MTPDMKALARYAVTRKGWRWMAGMATMTDGCPNRVLEVEVNDKWGYGMEAVPVRMANRLIGGVCCEQWREYDIMPDLTDPATLGCLLVLVREACGDDEAYAQPWHDTDGGWTVSINDDEGCHIVAEGDTEVEALVAALEGAP